MVNKAILDSPAAPIVWIHCVHASPHAHSLCVLFLFGVFARIVIVGGNICVSEIT